MDFAPTYLGYPLVWTPEAVTRIRNFPVSKNRSRRIHKKLCKRFGGEFRHKPGCFIIGDKLYIHPALRHDFEKAIYEKNFKNYAHVNPAA